MTPSFDAAGLTRALRSCGIRVTDKTFGELLALASTKNGFAESDIALAIDGLSARQNGQSKSALAATLYPRLIATPSTAPHRRVLFATALPLEFAAVKGRLSLSDEQYLDTGNVLSVGTCPDLPDTTVGVIIAGQGNAVAAQATAGAISMFKPEVVVFVGIAGGLKTVSLGDVVVASHVYQLGHRSEAERAFSREKSIPGDQFLTQVATRISVDRADLYVGPIVAGDILLKNSRSDVATWIREHQNDALAIEMEGWGFSWSAHASGIPSLVVRGISDLIDGKNDEHDAKWQPAAAEAAASAAIAILAGGIQLRPRG